VHTESDVPRRVRTSSATSAGCLSNAGVSIHVGAALIEQSDPCAVGDRAVDRAGHGRRYRNEDARGDDTAAGIGSYDGSGKQLRNASAIARSSGSARLAPSELRRAKQMLISASPQLVRKNFKNAREQPFATITRETPVSQ
jgi:hypothetical protein